MESAAPPRLVELPVALGFGSSSQAAEGLSTSDSGGTRHQIPSRSLVRCAVGATPRWETQMPGPRIGESSPVSCILSDRACEVDPGQPWQRALLLLRARTLASTGRQKELKRRHCDLRQAQALFQEPKSLSPPLFQCLGRSTRSHDPCIEENVALLSKVQ